MLTYKSESMEYPFSKPWLRFSQLFNLYQICKCIFLFYPIQYALSYEHIISRREGVVDLTDGICEGRTEVCCEDVDFT